VGLPDLFKMNPGKQDPLRAAKTMTAIEQLRMLGIGVRSCLEHGDHVELVNRHGVLIWTQHTSTWPPSAKYLDAMKDYVK